MGAKAPSQLSYRTQVRPNMCNSLVYIFPILFLKEVSNDKENKQKD